MSMQTVKVPLADLGTVRVVCAVCRCAIEGPIEKLDATELKCPCCQARLIPGNQNFLGDLARIRNSLLGRKNVVEIEFALEPEAAGGN